MLLKLLAASAALLVPAAAQAQQSWYLTGANDGDSALIFTERSSVKFEDKEGSATTLLVRVSKGEDPSATSATLTFDCAGKRVRIDSVQPLKLDGTPASDAFPGDGEWMPVAQGSFYEGTRKFVCGGSARPDPALLIGSKPPIQAGIGYLRGKQAATK